MEGFPTSLHGRFLYVFTWKASLRLYMEGFSMSLHGRFPYVFTWQRAMWLKNPITGREPIRSFSVLDTRYVKWALVSKVALLLKTRGLDSSVGRGSVAQRSRVHASAEHSPGPYWVGVKIM
ncbi:hypothetical protein ElyMa_002297700 [Elysia marginata]|uniref:Uncharacterized protein n=1 Tax=Elysia marginata TaxID=1093978 RepID=A0AAV4G575_9GAST|nr:hypothetical protein ElyMa_002297700 [Elysia marginata]